MSQTKYTHSQATCEILILHQVLQIHVKCKPYSSKHLYNFTDCSLLLCQRMPYAPKCFANSHKTAKFGKVFCYTVISGGAMYGTYSCTPDMMLADTPSSPRYSEMEWFFTRYSCATFPIAYSTAPPRQNRSPLSWSEAEM